VYFQNTCAEVKIRKGYQSNCFIYYDRWIYLPLINIVALQVLSFTYIWTTFLLAHLSTKYSDLIFCDSGVSVVCLVYYFYKQNILLNHLMDLDQTLQEWSLSCPSLKFYKRSKDLILAHSVFRSSMWASAYTM
jgi:hypothetical protein